MQGGQGWAGAAGAPELGLEAPPQRDSVSRAPAQDGSPPRRPGCAGPSDTARVRQGAVAGRERRQDHFQPRGLHCGEVRRPQHGTHEGGDQSCCPGDKPQRGLSSAGPDGRGGAGLLATRAVS